jgi:hypothetical protein
MVVDFRDNMALVTMPRLRKQGWVHKNALRVGTAADRKYGSIKILSDVPTGDLNNLQLQTSSDRFDGTVEGLMYALKTLQSAPILDNILPTEVTDTLNNNARFYGALSSIKIGTCREYRELVSRDDFTVSDLMSSLPAVPLESSLRGTLGGGIYHVVVYQFKNKPRRKPEIYTGQTNDFLRRLWEETHVFGKPTSDLARAVEAADTVNGQVCVRMRVACRLPAGTDRWVVNLAEQLFLLCGQTYSSRSLCLLRSDGTILTREQVSNTLNYFAMDNAAARLTTVANAVFKKTSWPGMRSRESFGAAIGLNLSSPLCGEPESRSKTIWVETSVPGVMKHYRKGPKTTGVTRNPTVFAIHFKDRDGNELNFAPSLPVGAAPAHTDFWTVIEIMDDTPHPFPWCRREMLDVWDDSYYADRIAMAVEFESPKGTWYK